MFEIRNHRPCSAAAFLLAGVPAPCVAASLCFVPLCGTEGLEGWSFDAGVAMITESHIEDFVLGSLNPANGPGAGEIYSFTVSRRIGEFRWNIGGFTFTPQVEIPLNLEIVDENTSSPFVTLNASFAVRWVDYPWNDYVKTTFSMGLGLSYADQIYAIDIVRHPGEKRSKLKFNWPIQLTLALPEHPDHQVTIFISHHSGGHIFDEGGFNSLGMGYRREF